jgi:hypothetical protein
MADINLFVPNGETRNFLSRQGRQGIVRKGTGIRRTKNPRTNIAGAKKNRFRRETGL